MNTTPPFSTTTTFTPLPELLADKRRLDWLLKHWAVWIQQRPAQRDDELWLVKRREHIDQLMACETRGELTNE
jgi:hypothetical protein